jgi:aerobic carbon-monoxide dehydrogenase medium subunit
VSFELHRPATLEEAVRLAGRLAPNARFIAGGTDLVIQMSRSRFAPGHVIALPPLPELQGVTDTADGYRLGALTTYRGVEQHAAFKGALAALIEAARVVGGQQVRNIATVGGNIVNASPAADFVPALLCLEATLEIIGPQGTRSVPLNEIIRGPGATDLQPGEIVTAIDFARLPKGSATAFLKEGRRKAMEISVVCVAASLMLDTSGTCTKARIAIGAAAPRAFRVTAAEQALQGKTAGHDVFVEAGRLAAEDVTPISDVRASADYRRYLASVMVERVLTACHQRILDTRQ